MVLNTVTAVRASASRQIRRAGTPPFRQSPCQSDIKRTLRRSRARQNARFSQPFSAAAAMHSARMVNDGFRRANAYGFEMVDTAADAAQARQSKIYERIGSTDSLANFRRIKLRQTLPIYRGLLVRIRRRELSDVLFAALDRKSVV